MPSVAQVSSPSALTPSTMAQTESRSRSFGLRHAAPMQKRLAPPPPAPSAPPITEPIVRPRVRGTSTPRGGRGGRRGGCAPPPGGGGARGGPPPGRGEGGPPSLPTPGRGGGGRATRGGGGDLRKGAPLLSAPLS